MNNSSEKNSYNRRHTRRSLLIIIIAVSEPFKTRDIKTPSLGYLLGGQSQKNGHLRTLSAAAADASKIIKFYLMEKIN